MKARLRSVERKVRALPEPVTDFDGRYPEALKLLSLHQATEIHRIFQMQANHESIEAEEDLYWLDIWAWALKSAGKPCPNLPAICKCRLLRVHSNALPQTWIENDSHKDVEASQSEVLERSLEGFDALVIEGFSHYKARDFAAAVARRSPSLPIIAALGFYTTVDRTNIAAALPWGYDWRDLRAVLARVTGRPRCLCPLYRDDPS